MELVDSIGKKMGKTVNKMFKLHSSVELVVVLVLALYAGMAAPALPNVVIEFADSIVGRLIFLFLIGYVASKNMKVAIMVALAFVITLHVANKRVTENYINALRYEKFYGGCDPACDISGGQTCVEGKCVDTFYNPVMCVGNQCGENQICTDGECVDSVNNPVMWSGNQCGENQICVEGECVDSCNNPEGGEEAGVPQANSYTHSHAHVHSGDDEQHRVEQTANGTGSIAAGVVSGSAASTADGYSSVEGFLGGAQGSAEHFACSKCNDAACTGC